MSFAFGGDSDDESGVETDVKSEKPRKLIVKIPKLAGGGGCGGGGGKAKPLVAGHRHVAAKKLLLDCTSTLDNLKSPVLLPKLKKANVEKMLEKVIVLRDPNGHGT